MNKVVVNDCYGGFNLSDEAVSRLNKLGFDTSYGGGGLCRHDPTLVQVVEELGVERSSGQYSRLKIVEIEGSRYIINEYDGLEEVLTPKDIEWINID